MYSHLLNAGHSGGDFSEDAAFGVCSFRERFWVPSAAALSARHLYKSDHSSQKTGADASDVTGVTQPSFLLPPHSPRFLPSAL